jgi:hypothetical protein
MAIFVELKDEDTEPPQDSARPDPGADIKPAQGEPSRAHASAKPETGVTEKPPVVTKARNVVAEAFSCYP